LDHESETSSIKDDSFNGAKPISGSAPTAATSYSARIAQTYRQVMEARQARRTDPPKEYYYCVLKSSVLFLYEDEGCGECVAAIGVDRYRVGIENVEGKKRWEGKDAEMFAKRNGIVLRLDKEKDGGGMPALAKGMAGVEGGNGEAEKDMEAQPWFLFSKSNTK
jgi:hypothetical protein